MAKKKVVRRLGAGTAFVRAGSLVGVRNNLGNFGPAEGVYIYRVMNHGTASNPLTLRWTRPDGTADSVGVPPDNSMDVIGSKFSFAGTHIKATYELLAVIA